MFSDSARQQLKKNIRGALIHPGDAVYDATRKVWNRMIDRHPALIARCLGTADVVRCVEFAREHSLAVAVRGGGHNIAGKCVCDDGLLIDLSAMKGIHVDAVRRTARAQAGLRLGEFDRETQVFGLATTMGIATDTGVAGITLGGGYGWLDGKFGLACDNLISAEVVTAEGKVVTASAEENPDLFWGLRGGSGNFGIVTLRLNFDCIRLARF
jgi:FAD/FMN-containing dehydrogenase